MMCTVCHLVDMQINITFYAVKNNKFKCFGDKKMAVPIPKTE